MTRKQRTFDDDEESSLPPPQPAWHGPHGPDGHASGSSSATSEPSNPATTATIMATPPLPVTTKTRATHQPRASAPPPRQESSDSSGSSSSKPDLSGEEEPPARATTTTNGKVPQHPHLPVTTATARRSPLVSVTSKTAAAPPPPPHFGIPANGQQTTIPVPEPGQRGIVLPDAQQQQQQQNSRQLPVILEQTTSTSTAKTPKQPPAHVISLLSRLEVPRGGDEEDPMLFKNDCNKNNHHSSTNSSGGNLKTACIPGRTRAVERGHLSENSLISASHLPGQNGGEVKSTPGDNVRRPPATSKSKGGAAAPAIQHGAFSIGAPAPQYVEGDDEEFDWDAFYEGRNVEVPTVPEYDDDDEEEEVPPPPPEDDEDSLVDDEECIMDAEVEAAPREDVDAAKPSFVVRRLGIIVLAIVIIVATAVVLGVLLRGDGGGGDSPNTVEPTTMAPTPAPDPWADCFATTRALATALVERNSELGFIDVELCHHSLIRVADVDRVEPYNAASPAIVAQSNMRVRCGEDGSLLNECIVQNGDVLLLNSHYLPAAWNVTFEGITFESGVDALMELTNAGDITFRNCRFRNVVDSTPIIIGYRGDAQDPSIRQTISFESCIFEDMTFSLPTAASQSVYQDAVTMILATGPSNVVVVKDSVFRRNQANGQLPAGLITSLGAEVRVEGSCFYDNDLGRQGSPILLSGDETVMSFHTGDNYAETSNGCNLVGQLHTEMNVTCGNIAEEDVCRSSWNT